LLVARQAVIFTKVADVTSTVWNSAMVEPSRVEEIFSAALEKRTPDERAAFLDDACRDEPDLRQRIEKLLAAKQDENGNAAVAATREHVEVPTDTIGSKIGPYKLLQRLGEGGMGVVYLAEQEHPVKRRVALKIIKTGMDSAQVAARFEQERQALAMMDHPNIAKVLDAGATAWRWTSGGTLRTSR
jgi:serine/threonine protein kinase